MRAPRERSPKVERLEGKQLLSTLGTAQSQGHPSGVNHPAPLVLDGKFTVNFAKYNAQVGATSSGTNSPIPDAMPFSGKARSLGPVTGQIRLLTDPAGNPLPQGVIELTNPKGTVRLGYDLNEPMKTIHVRGGTSGLRHYTVLGGTGAYANAHGAGTATLTTFDRGPSESLTLHTTKSS